VQQSEKEPKKRKKKEGKTIEVMMTIECSLMKRLMVKQRSGMR